MKRSSIQRPGCVLAGVLAIALTSAVHAGEPTGAAASDSIFEMEPAMSFDGKTFEQYFADQHALNTRLIALMPDGTLNTNPIRVQLEQADANVIGTFPATEEPSPLCIGVVKSITPKVILTLNDLTASSNAQAGGLTRTSDGNLIWSRTVTSAGAGGLRVHLANLNLPAGVELFIFGTQGEAFGPYTLKGPDGSGDFWTPSIFSDTAVILISAHAGTTARGPLVTIDQVGHIGSDFVGGLAGGAEALAVSYCGNPTCVVDASCYNGTPADTAKNAIAKYEWIAGVYIYTCSGGLISDNNPSENNYFLTANHCINKSNNAKNAQFYWRFASSSCNGSCPSNSGWPYKTVGAAVRATNRTSDYTLMQLNNNPPSGSVFLGWTTAQVANSNGANLYRISNPNFGGQVYSAHNVDTGALTCQGWPRGAWIYSRDITGAINGGSSGSPVVNGSSQIVGQLSGTCGTNPNNVCASGPGGPNATVDGAFANYYNSVRTYLNP